VTAGNSAAASPGGIRLTVDLLLRRAVATSGGKEIVAIAESGERASATWGGLAERVSRLVEGLRMVGVRPGDRVATFAWNSLPHLELFFAVPMAGAVLHPVNVRFTSEQIAFVLDHAEDSVAFVAASLTPQLAKLLPAAMRLRTIVVIPDGAPVDPAFAAAVDYEWLLAAGADGGPAGRPAERALPGEDDAACLFYTSGTTGDPKGIVHSHRSVVLHSMGVCMADAFAIRERDVALPLTPLFHAAAWGIPYAAAITGAGLVFAGPHLSPEEIAGTLARERVTFAAGVPTFWLALDQAKPPAASFATLDRIVCGGSMVPASLIRAYQQRGVTMQQGLGLSEMVALVALTGHRSTAPHLTAEQVHTTQGVPVAGVEARLTGEDGAALPNDGATVGQLEVRSVWGASAYLDPGAGAARDTSFLADGWLRTGDVGTVDAYGQIRLTDRAKDVIKSGGEWISSAALESMLMDHPQVAAAAVIATPDPRWGERPLAIVVRRPGSRVRAEELAGYLKALVPGWWVPDRFEFAGELPLTATNKFDKKVLRSRYA
jgi:acyl-CoA synthetase (AMP-forming)/AMP-acid ligase II